MILWRRAVPLGFVSWSIPFALSFVLFPLKRANAPLYSSLLNIIGLCTTAWMLNLYYRGRTSPRSVPWTEALLLGAFWAALNLAFDAPFFSIGPMRMEPSLYWSEIGLSYLTIPVFTAGAARLAR
jgi:hypothetical protein